jgi:hypothetical protein
VRAVRAIGDGAVKAIRAIGDSAVKAIRAAVSAVSGSRATLPVAAVTVATGAAVLAMPTPARAVPLIGSQCAPGIGIAGAGCSSVGSGVLGGATDALTAATLADVVGWVGDGAQSALNGTAQVLGATTTPQLRSTWFSATYWRVAGIAAVLTLPFLFAAALQALVRSDVTLLIRAAIGYLPLALLAVGIAAPLTMLLLAASDQMSSIVSSAASNQGAQFLAHAAGLLGSFTAGVTSPFVMLLVGLLTVVGALVLWMELLMREAAVYVIVLMLPLAFAAFVWPARRVWAIRSIEVLIALILSKFVIVAVLSLGGAALDQSANRSVTGLLAGGVLMALAAFSPWAMLRLIPLGELATAAAGSLSTGSHAALHRLRHADAWATEGDDWASRTAQMRDAALDAAGTHRAGSPSRESRPGIGMSEDLLQPNGSAEPDQAAAASTPRASAQGESPRAPSPAAEDSTPSADAASDDQAWGGIPSKAVRDIEVGLALGDQPPPPNNPPPPADPPPPNNLPPPTE